MQRGKTVSTPAQYLCTLYICLQRMDKRATNLGMEPLSKLFYFPPTSLHCGSKRNKSPQIHLAFQLSISVFLYLCASLIVLERQTFMLPYWSWAASSVRTNSFVIDVTSPFLPPFPPPSPTFSPPRLFISRHDQSL